MLFRSNLTDNLYLVAGPSFKYLTTAAGTVYLQSGGQHQWYNTPSGTAGTTATVTQAMTLDASGYLLLGTTTSTNAIATFGNNSSGSGYGVYKYSAFFGANLNGTTNPTNSWGLSIGWNRSSGGGESNIVYGTGIGTITGDRKSTRLNSSH